MNIKRNVPPRKKIIITTIIILLATALTVVALEKTGITNFIKPTPTPYSGPTEAEKNEQRKTEQEAKQDFIETPEPTEVETSDASIDLSARQEPDGSVTVLSKLYGIPDGNCNLTISNTGKTYTQEAEIIYQPTFSSCAGFSIPKDRLGAGAWSINLIVNSHTQLEKSMILEVK